MNFSWIKIIENESQLETAVFYNLLSTMKMRERTNIAFELNNNLNYLKKFVDSLVDFVKDFNFIKIFLFVFEFGVNFMRLPFILFLQETDFCENIREKIRKWGKEEKESFKLTLENALELFINTEAKHANICLCYQFCKLYESINNCPIQFFFNCKMKNLHKIVQTKFEKRINQFKFSLTNYEVLLTSLPFEKIKINELLETMKELKPNFQICQNAAETKIFQVLEEKKEEIIFQIEKNIQKNAFINKGFLSIQMNQNLLFFRTALQETNYLHEQDVMIITKDYFYKQNQDVKKDLEKNIFETINSPSKLLSSTSSIKNSTINQEENEEFKNINNEITNKKKTVESSLEDYTAFEFNSHLPFLENTELEFKKYSFPFKFNHYSKLKKTICAFLNSNGGRIYFGIRDEDQCVLGMRISEANKEIFFLSIKNTMDMIIPTPNIDDYSIHFIPVYTMKNGQKFDLFDVYIVKLLVKRGKLNDLYFTNDRISYTRRNGKNSLLQPVELKAEVIKRSNLDDAECEKTNQEYNRTRFYDYENLRYIIQTKNLKTSLKRNYTEAFVNC